MNLASVFSTLGILFSFGLFFSPMFSVIKSLKTRKIENISFLFVGVFFLSAFLWVCYGIRVDVWEILVPNTVSFTLQTIYIFIFIVIYPEKLKYVKYIVLFFLLFLCIAFFLSIHVLGFLAMLFNILTFLSLTERIIPTIAFREPKFMNILITSLATLNCAAWMLFAILIQDVWVVIPNAIGVLLGFLQLYVYIWAKGWTEDSKIIIPILRTCLRIEHKTDN